MLNRIVEWSVNNRLLAILLIVLIAGLGIRSMIDLPIDVVPDITTNQVTINTALPGWTPLEIEEQVTYPIEVAMTNLPNVEEVRSLSKFALSQVTIVFKESVDTYFARQLVLERLQTVKEDMPPGVEPAMGPVTTGLGEIVHYTIEGDDKSSTELRTVQNWFIAPRLRTTPGLAEVNSWGGFVKQYHVLVDPAKLLTYGLTLHQVFESLANNNINIGAAYIEHAREQYLIRGVGRINNMADIGDIAVKSHDGTPVYIRDVAVIEEGTEVRQGAATMDGRGEVVIGIAMLLKGENGRTIADAVKKKLSQIQESLPKGVFTRIFYDRETLVNDALRTILVNLTEGGVLVSVILFTFLGNIRAGLIVAATIPLSMCLAFLGMRYFGISGNLMSLGAIDFGLIVDGAVVMVENVVRQIEEYKRNHGDNPSKKEFLSILIKGCQEVGRPVLFGILIITLVYLPIITLEGIEGKMFKPMAFTVIMALGASLLLTFTWIPAMIALGFKGGAKELAFLSFMRKSYTLTLRRLFQYRKWLILGSIAAVFGTIVLFGHLGSEFLPKLDEGAMLFQIQRLPSVSLSESVKQSLQVEKVLKTFPEVIHVISRTGSPEIATDPMGPETSDVWVLLEPKQKWRFKNKTKLIENMEEELSKIPGLVISLSQPIEMRFNELIAGVRSDLAIKIFGEDFSILREKGLSIVESIQNIQGAKDLKIEQTTGLPMLSIKVDRKKIARYGVHITDVMEAIETAIGGKTATVVLEGNKRFSLQVRFPEETPGGWSKKHPEEIGNLLISTQDGGRIPLRQVAELVMEEGPAQISREHGARRVVVELNVRGRDIGSFVKEAEEIIRKNVSLPPGYYIEWGGQFQNLERAQKRLLVVVPLALFLVFILLMMTFNSPKQALLVFTGAPFAAIGGVVALWLRGMPFSISAGIGFIALTGIAVLNGVVMVSYMNSLRTQGMELIQAVIQGASVRLRPVLMTALVASIGFLPMALSTGTGAEVQKPLATVVIGGLVSSTVLTLFLLPLLYHLLERKKD